MMTAAIIAIATGVVILVAALWMARGGNSRGSEASAGRSGERADTADQGPAPETKEHWLLGRSEEIRGKKYHVGERKATIGRQPGNFIQLSGSNVSRVHCRVDGSGRRCTIEDLESSHGTYVNDRRLNADTAIPLRDGDAIRIGDTELVYRRETDFHTDDALTDRKRVDDDTRRRTVAPGEVDVGNPLLAAVKEADGGVEEVADDLGMEPEEILDRLSGDADDD